MGYINTGGQQVHTSSLSNSIFGTPSVSSGSLSIGTSSSAILTISGTNSLITSSTAAGQYLTWGGSTINYTTQKTTYHVLGEDIEVDGYSDPSLAVAISTLNILGKPFYDEVKKNGIVFPDEIEKYLKYKLKVIDRDRKINDLLNK